MKAISPVIATLILIGISVIAGIFVLRQFLVLSVTSGEQNMLQIQDAVLFRVIKHMSQWNSDNITVTLQISIKNIGQRVVNITNITVDNHRLKGFEGIMLNPGQTYTGAYDVILHDNSTIAPYDPDWDTGTEHIVTVYYQVLGQPSTQTTSTKAIVQ